MPESNQAAPPPGADQAAPPPGADQAAPPPGADPAQPAQLATARAQVRRSLLPVALAHGLVVWVLWQQGVGGAGLAWWCAVTAVNAARSWHGQHHSASATPAAQARAMAAWLALMGLLEPVPLLLCAQFGSLESQYLVTMILLGLTVGGVSNLAGQWWLYVVWAWPLCLVLLAQWLARGGVEGVGIAALIAMLFGLLGSYVRDYGALLRSERRLAEDLRQERDRATAAVQARSQFFMAASHDLRQPLGAIRWYGEAVVEHAHLLHHDTLAEIGAGLASAVARTEPMLAQFLEIGQLDAPAAAIGPAEPMSPVAVANLLHSLADAWQPEARTRRLGLTVHIEPQLVERLVCSNDAALRRILDNLIANAFKFTATGSVSLSARRADFAPGAMPPTERGERSNGVVRLSVRDTGIGIAPEHLPRLFDDFYQVPQAGRSATRGVGLGLAIARRHAQRLGLQLQVHSALGEGSCFSFELPLLPLLSPADLDQPALSCSSRSCST